MTRKKHDTDTILYEPFYVLGAFLKIPDLIQLTQNGTAQGSSRVDEFYGHVERYRRHRENLSREYLPDSLEQWGCDPANRLYQPIHVWTFGYIDELILLLVDTPDFYFRVFGESTTAVSQVCLAAVPEMESIGIQPRQVIPDEHGQVCSPHPFNGSGWNFQRYTEDHWGRDIDTEAADLAALNPFVRLNDLFHPGLNGDWHSPDSMNDVDPKLHPLRFSTPLVLFTRIRLSSACNLGGIVMRRAVYRLIARVIVATQLRLLEALQNTDEKRQLQDLQITEDEIRNLSVSFLDNLGPEELGILIGSRNYSVAFSVHNAIQAMTFRDLVAAEEHMRGDIERSLIHDSLKNMLGESDDPERLLLDNHLISMTHTSVGMVSESLTCLNGSATKMRAGQNVAPLENLHRDELKSYVNGFTEVSVKATVSAGHNSDVDGKLREISRYVQEAAAHDKGSGSACPISDLAADDRFLRVLVGRYDLEFMGRGTSGNQAAAPVAVSHVFSAMESLLAEIAGGDGDQVETGIAEISTALVVPIPQFEADESRGMPQNPVRRVRTETYTPLIRALSNIGTEIFGKSQNAVMSSAQQSAAARFLRLPIRLRRIVRSIGNVFQTALCDPVLFDHVLDLYDCVTALNHAITHDLPKLTNQALDDIGEPDSKRVVDLPVLIRRVEEVLDGSIGRDLIDGLGEYAEALADALDRRISVETQHEFSEFAVDMRGGLVQLVHTAGVALKCGGGLLRFAFDTDFGTYTERIPTNKRVGLINRLTVHDVRRRRRVQLASGSDAELAVFTFGVGHLISPLEFEIYIHEAARMLIVAWDEQDGMIPEGPRPRPGFEDPLDIRLHSDPFPSTDEDEQRASGLRQDLFATALTQRLIYGTDLDLAQRVGVATYDAQHEAGSINRLQSFRLFASFMLTCFFARNVLQNSAEDCAFEWLTDGSSPDSASRDVTSAAFGHFWRRFHTHCRDHSYLFHRHAGFHEWLREVIVVLVNPQALLSSRVEGHVESAQQLTRQYILQVECLRDVKWRVDQIHESYRRYYWKNLGEDDFQKLEDLVSDCLGKGIGSVQVVMTEFNRYLSDRYSDGSGSVPEELRYRGWSGNSYSEADEHVNELMILCLILKSLARQRIHSTNPSDSSFANPKSRRYTVSPISALHEDHASEPWPVTGMVQELVTNWEHTEAFGLQRDEPKRSHDVIHDRRYNRFFGIHPRTRRELLQQEIAAIRMLWSLSTRQRARRLHKLAGDVRNASGEKTAQNGENPQGVAGTSTV